MIILIPKHICVYMYYSVLKIRGLKDFAYHVFIKIGICYLRMILLIDRIDCNFVQNLKYIIIRSVHETYFKPFKRKYNFLVQFIGRLRFLLLVSFFFLVEILLGFAFLPTSLIAYIIYYYLWLVD